MKTYTKQDFHNPEQLTRQQVGEEYRLLLPNEVDGRFSKSRGGNGECYLLGGNVWKNRECWDRRYTFRVPLATPLPDGTVLSSNECCWSDQPRKKRVYCAGGMTGYPDWNFPAFYSAAESLEKQGYEPVNPAELDRIAGFSLERIKQLNPSEFQEFLKGAAKRDLDALQQCDAIALLPGWENSKGARAELAVAEWLGLRVYYLYRKNEFYQWAPLSKAEYYDLPSDKQPYNSDERAEWDVSGLIPKIQSSIASDDPKGAAGAKKPPMHLLPTNALIETAKAMGHGAAKYGAWNFIETTVCASTYVGALGRHWAAYARSEDIDPDSGLPHLALIAANCFVLLTAQQQGTLRDDRPKLRQI